MLDLISYYFCYCYQILCVLIICHVTICINVNCFWTSKTRISPRNISNNIRSSFSCKAKDLRHNPARKGDFQHALPRKINPGFSVQRKIRQNDKLQQFRAKSDRSNIFNQLYHTHSTRVISTVKCKNNLLIKIEFLSELG